MKKFNSFEKEKFIVGKEYYTYYIELTKKYNAILYYTGIMKVKVLSNEKTEYSDYKYTTFEILEAKPLSKALAHNIHIYMNGYGLASTNFFENLDDCIKEHDKDIIKYTKNQNTKNKERMLKKLINKNNNPSKTKIEIQSIEWYNKLSKKEKMFVKWIKHYWSNI